MRPMEARLENGLTILADPVRGASTTAVSFFVRAGSRDEAAGEAGISHFLEHMCFKGTERRNAIEVSRDLDRIGARANAFTSWEMTAYHARTLPEYVEDALDVIADFMMPAIRTEDFETERNVILEEIALYEDRPDYLIYDAAVSERFRGHPLSTRILGSSESIRNLSPEAMRRYQAEKYSPSRITLVAAGLVDFDRLVEAAERRCSHWRDKGGEDRLLARPPDEFESIEIEREKDSEVRLIHLFSGPEASDRERLQSADILADILGGEENSRLYWRLVHTGIVESAWTGSLSFEETGLFYIGITSSPERFSEAREILEEEIDGLRSRPPGEKEVETARARASSRLALSHESPMGRIRALGEDAAHRLPPISTEERLKRIESFTRDEVIREAERILASRRQTTVIGPLERL